MNVKPLGCVPNFDVCLAFRLFIAEGEETLLLSSSCSTPPYVLLMFGLFSIFLAVAGMLTGEAWARFGSPVYRNEKPKEFWLLITTYYLGGAFFIGYFLYTVYGPSSCTLR
jgi:hypothetical protein